MNTPLKIYIYIYLKRKKKKEEERGLEEWEATYKDKNGRGEDKN